MSRIGAAYVDMVVVPKKNQRIEILTAKAQRTQREFEPETIAEYSEGLQINKAIPVFFEPRVLLLYFFASFAYPSRGYRKESLR